MGKKRKPFIDKKNATTYRLVHRSQKDPLVADNDANQMVLDPIPDKDERKSARLAEQQEYGIYYDDDYDYMQHLRSREEGDSIVWESTNPTRPGKVVLPPCVLPSAKEEPIGMLNLAAPRGLDLTLDPDVVAALDGDFDFDDPDNELEDDFIDMADGVASDEEDEDGSEYGSEFDDDIDSLCGGRFSDNDGIQEERARFTEYSVSSSVLPRNEGLTLLDDKFEQMFGEYEELGAGEDDICPVDEVEETSKPNKILEQLCDEFEQHGLDNEEFDDQTRRATLRLAEVQANKPERKTIVEEDKEDRNCIAWDCETILSTYTNIYNHPKVIDIPTRVKLDKRGMAVDDKLPAGDVEVGVEAGPESDEVDEEEGEVLIISNLRTKSETPEDRKARKKAVKENQRIRRKIKKATKEVFKEEKTKENRMYNNNSTQKIKTIKL